MSESISKTTEIMILCPLYKKACVGCPSDSSKNYVLPEKDLQILLNSCSTEKYESCSIFIANHELAA